MRDQQIHEVSKETVCGRLAQHLADSVQGELSGEQPGYSMVPGQVSRAEYRALLERLYGWYAHMDARLVRLDPLNQILVRHGSDIGQFQRVGSLERDLAQFNCTGIGLVEIPRCSGIGRVRSVVDGLALLYVSSTWEARLVEVAERMYAVWGVTAGSGADFFDRSSQLVRGNQASLGRAIEEFCAKPARERRLQQCAASALSRLTDWVHNPIEGERFLPDSAESDAPREEE